MSKKPRLQPSGQFSRLLYSSVSRRFRSKLTGPANISQFRALDRLRVE